MSESVVLAQETIEELARALAPAIAEVLADTLARDAYRPRVVDAAELAEILGLHVDTVRNRAEQLGGVRVLTGEKGRPRWRFDLDRVLAAHRPANGDLAHGSPDSRIPPPRRRARRSDVPLLPLKGDAA